MRPNPGFTVPLLASVFLVLAGPALGATYYVSPSGNDANACSLAAPCRQIRRALTLVQPGDTILVADGQYLGFNVSGINGTAGQPITIKAQGTGAIVTVTTDRSDNRDTIFITASSYVVVDGLTSFNANRAAVRVDSSDHVTIQNGVFGNNATWGIFTDFSNDLLIQNNKTYGSAQQHGIYVSNSNSPNDNPILRGNESYGNYQNGIQLNGDCESGGDGIIEDALLENNYIHDNGNKGFSIISAPRTTLRNNLTYNNGARGAAGGIHLTDQPGCNLPSSNSVVVNNTLVEPRIAGIRVNGGSTGSVIFNNLVVSNTPIADEEGLSLIDTTSNLSRASSAGIVVNGTSDFHLVSGSPAIDAGRSSYQSRLAPVADYDGNTRPAGSGFDIGAFEYGSSPPTPPPPGGNPPPGPGQPPLPPAAPQVSLSLPHWLARNATIPVSVTGVYDTITWSFSANPAVSSPGNPGGGRASAGGTFYSISTRSPALDLGGVSGPSLGSWHVTVTASNGSAVSSPAEGDVTLVTSDLAAARVYPNPWRSDRHQGKTVTFDLLTLNSTVKIFTASGHLVRTLDASSGSASWDLKNDSGDAVASGVYLYLITNDQGQKSRGKVAVIK